MSQRKKQGSASPKAPRRERRAFSEAFKREAVRRLHARAAGVSVTQLGRELDIRPDQLRESARRLAAQEGGLAAAGVVETPEQELQRLRRENAQLREAEAFAKTIAVYFAKESR
jgi:transposase-like protein